MKTAISRRVLTVSIQLVILLFALYANPASAAQGDCGQPISDGSLPVAGDCLAVLKNAVGLLECDSCICDVNGSGTATASDALLCLSYALGLNVTLACAPCGPDESDTHKSDYVGPLPTLSIDPPSPVGLNAATVTVSAPGATSIELFASGMGCGEIVDQSISGSLLEVSGDVGRFGSCDLAATVTGGEVDGVHLSQFTVEPIELVLPGLRVLGGAFVPGPLPESSPGGGLDVVSIQSPPTLINGGLATALVEIADTDRLADVVQVFVGVETSAFFSGYWSVPAVVEDGKLKLLLALAADYQPPSLTSSPRSLTADGVVMNGTNVMVKVRDKSGDTGGPYEMEFATADVGNGDVQVSLSWDTPTDVDLHMVEPGGWEIYYSYPLSPNYGRLDLDSNAGCDIDGINNENIQYAQKGAPPGEYIVRVDFYWSCEDMLPAHYTVNINNCGERSVYSGEFAAGEDDRGGQGAGREVARFVAACTSRAAGTARYEDFAPTSQGLAAISTMKPIRFAKVEVRRDFDDEVLATSTTGQDGTFDILFENEGIPGYYVLVIAEHDAGYIDQRVVNNANLIYAVQSSSYDEQLVPDNMNIVVDAMRSSGGPAPAFNIFDAGVTGGLLLHELNSNAPPYLNWLWTSGQPGTCSGSVSCYSSKNNTISVLSTPADPDEYDDLVLLHEYGHFFQKNYSRDNSPGGSHSATTPSDPRLAWSEGSATFVGNSAKRTSLYLDTNQSGIGIRSDLEALAAKIPLGTSNGQQNGNLSEDRVAAILWDLADSTNENFDTVTNRQGVFTAMLGLHGSAFTDRNVVGADLVDLLDAWFCAGLNNRGDTGNGVQAIVSTMHGFPYDFAKADGCD